MPAATDLKWRSPSAVPALAITRTAQSEAAVPTPTRMRLLRCTRQLKDTRSLSLSLCCALLCSGARGMGSPHPPLCRAAPSRHFERMGLAIHLQFRGMAGAPSAERNKDSKPVRSGTTHQHDHNVCFRATLAFSLCVGVCPETAGAPTQPTLPA